MAERTRHDEEHERVLQDVLTGDRSRDEAAVRHLLSSCEECANALAELEELAGALDADARAEHDILGAPFVRIAAPARPSTAPHPRLVPSIEDEPEEVPATPFAPQASARRRAMTVLVPLAAAILAVLVHRHFRQPSQRTPIVEPGLGLPLGSEETESLSPSGEVASFETFRWEADLPSGGWYTLQVWAGRREPLEQPLIDEVDLTQPSWTPSAEQLVTLPGRIEWQVRVYDATGSPGATYRAEAWLPGS